LLRVSELDKSSLGEGLFAQYGEDKGNGCDSIRIVIEELFKISQKKIRAKRPFQTGTMIFMTLFIELQ
jgi:hypothetical protein